MCVEYLHFFYRHPSMQIDSHWSFPKSRTKVSEELLGRFLHTGQADPVLNQHGHLLARVRVLGRTLDERPKHDRLNHELEIRLLASFGVEERLCLAEVLLGRHGELLADQGVEAARRRHVVLDLARHDPLDQLECVFEADGPEEGGLEVLDHRRLGDCINVIHDDLRWRMGLHWCEHCKLIQVRMLVDR